MSEVNRWYTRDPDKFLPTAQVRVVRASDYDALAAMVAELEQELQHIAAGGSYPAGRARAALGFADADSDNAPRQNHPSHKDST